MIPNLNLAADYRSLDQSTGHGSYCYFCLVCLEPEAGQRDVSTKVCLKYFPCQKNNQTKQGNCLAQYGEHSCNTVWQL